MMTCRPVYTVIQFSEAYCSMQRKSSTVPLLRQVRHSAIVIMYFDFAKDVKQDTVHVKQTLHVRQIRGVFQPLMFN